ncbi:beta/gamma crystallin domain-containing protein [Amycolatopsis panacis]|uniref:Oxidoreductase n=1 Tax=Amycolatopsis panacis TaxID=2340917 RepID=A0A419I7E0_9PSEU|nr:beta/gamma crystallin domain-containing protein [Amycolatopsis panacis]RJQ87713.1 oxidoreductase [Amycolatopsis panacis]
MRSRTKVVGAAAAAAAMVFTLTVPTGVSFAINGKPCNTGSDYLEVWYRKGDNITIHECWANAGRVAFEKRDWIHRIKTGNNNVIYQDRNGAPPIRIGRWQDRSFPNRPANVEYIAIE